MNFEGCYLTQYIQYVQYQMMYSSFASKDILLFSS